MPRVVVSKVEELPRELWFGRTGPLERLSLKRSLAKLEAAGLCPSWSRVDPLLAYLRECVAELGSYAKCAAVVGATRNTIRDACRGRYVPGFDRLLAWGRRLAEHSRGLSGLVLTVDLPDEAVAARRFVAAQDPGVKLTATARAQSARDTVNAARPVRLLDSSHYTQGEDAAAAESSPLAPRGRPHTSATTKSRESPAPGLIPSSPGTCPPRGTAAIQGAPAPAMRAHATFTQGEPTASAPSETSEPSALGVVSKTAPKIEARLGVVSSSAPTRVGEEFIAAPETLGEHSNCTHCRRMTLGEDDVCAQQGVGVVSSSAPTRVGEHSNCTHCRRMTLGEDDVCEQQGVGVHSRFERRDSSRHIDKRSIKKSLNSRLVDPVSMPAMVVAEFRCGGRSVRAGCFDTEEQARRVIDSLLGAKIYEGEPYIDGRLYTRVKSQEELIDELVERKFQAMAASQAEQAQYHQSVIATYVFNVIKGVWKNGTVKE